MADHLSPQNTYFIIEIVNPLGKRGFAIETPQGIKFCVGGYDMNTRQFSTQGDALEFSKNNKLYQLGKIHILSNHDIMQKYGKVMKGRMFVIVNDKDWHLFWDTAQEGYYFMNRFAGCCCWYDQKEVNKFIEEWQPLFGEEKLIAKPVDA